VQKRAEKGQKGLKGAKKGKKVQKKGLKGSKFFSVSGPGYFLLRYHSLVKYTRRPKKSLLKFTKIRPYVEKLG
jgi:hypothetical protein